MPWLCSVETSGAASGPIAKSSSRISSNACRVGPCVMSEQAYAQATSWLHSNVGSAVRISRSSLRTGRSCARKNALRSALCCTEVSFARRCSAVAKLMLLRPPVPLRAERITSSTVTGDFAERSCVLICTSRGLLRAGVGALLGLLPGLSCDSGSPPWASPGCATGRFSLRRAGWAALPPRRAAALAAVPNSARTPAPAARSFGWQWYRLAAARPRGAGTRDSRSSIELT
mmetsp:Transcript_25323/g.64377  ORF Transcript_25323/g.64377 Transcript_25323/m.64377 type:complete len:230 (-) Transcript_25323:76-765(-)